MARALTLQRWKERFPPIFIRLCVVRGRGSERHAPTDLQLANACGLTLAEFKFVSYSTAWADVTDRIALAYLRGCDVDLERRRDRRRLEWLRQRGQFEHLKQSPLWQFQFEEQVRLYMENC